MQNWHLLYNTATGASVSIGTVIADPVPAGITALPLTDEQGEGLQNGSLKWDEATRTLIPAPPPAVVAEEFLESNGYGPLRLVALLDLEAKLVAAQKSSAAMSAARNWIDGILAAYATDPSPRSDWPLPPVAFEDAVSGAMQSLAS